MKRHIFLIGIALVAVLYFAGKRLYLKPGFVKGETAVPFSGVLADGSQFQLSDLKGKYVLLDFWGSWCGPCIKDFPEMKKLKTKFNNAEFRNADGFEIVSIAIERDAGRWPRAIEKFELDWKYHLLDTVTNLRFFNGAISEAYGVKQLPTTYLLNPAGEIIGVNLPFEEINKILDRERV